MSSLVTDPQLRQHGVPEGCSAFHGKAVIVGIYGIPGSGKTFLLRQLKQTLGEEHFAYFEGSDMIASIVPGGLGAFQKLEEQEKMRWRQRATNDIAKKCADSGHVAVVAGHFMFWPEEQETGLPVYTKNDLKMFTHILYLDVPAEVVTKRRVLDKERSRPSTSSTHLRKWQQEEKTQLRKLCLQHGILFSLLFPHPTLLEKVSTLLRDFQQHDETHNLLRAEERLDDVLVVSQCRLETVLVIDADKTLAAEDTGKLFWQRVSDARKSKDEEGRLEELFSSPLGYSYTAFRQAALLYEETADDQEYDAFCQDVASEVAVRPEFVSLLQFVGENPLVGAVIVTCGLRCIWEKVLEREGLSKTAGIIGGGRIADGFVVTPAVKGALVERLRQVHQIYVWAFGDSPLDLDMLRMADQAIIVVGEEQTRSKSMDVALLNTIENGGLQARQAVLPNHASPRLDTNKLPLVQLTEPHFIGSVLYRYSRYADHQVLHATDRSAAKLLMTPMRDAGAAGPILREAHRRAGWYLATEFLADVIGLEEYPIPHVQGHHTAGHRLSHERQTSIVALMRGGEAMALGVNDAFPLAMFVHASRADDVKLHHLHGQLTVVLVDSVVNSGKTVVNFVQHVLKLHATIRIVVVAGVTQAQSLSSGSLAQELSRHERLTIIALRLSDNKFTGRGMTDTGNRLYNTTHVL